MKKNTLFIALISALLFSCNNESPVESNEEPTDSTATEISTLRTPTEDEIEELGILSGLEDIGYPRYTLSMEFPERQSKADFHLNIEEIEMDIETLDKLQGKYIKIYYTTAFENDIHDLIQNGKSVMHKEPIVQQENWKIFEGVLNGPAIEAQGDLPVTITITNAANESKDFKYFIDEEIVNLYGTKVSARYSSRGYDKVSFIAASN